MNAGKKQIQDNPSLEQCEESERFYNAGLFPKTCNTCKKIYPDRAQFLKETTALPTGTYSVGTRGRVFEYRNCGCGSTLICPVESQRDNSPEGDKRRAEFKANVEFLESNGVEKSKAIEIVREKFLKR